MVDTELNHHLIARWILDEAVAEQIISKTSDGQYVHFGEKNDYYVEVKLFPIKGRYRIAEGVD